MNELDPISTENPILNGEFDEKLINIPEESFKGEAQIVQEHKSNWFSFKKQEKSIKQEQKIVNEIVKKKRLIYIILYSFFSISLI